MLQINQDQETSTKKYFIKQPWKVFLIEAFLFSLTLLIGIAAAFRYNLILKSQKIEIPEISFWYFLFYFILATLFIFFIVRFVKLKRQKGIVFRVLFVLTVFWGGSLLLSAWISDAASLFLMTALIFWWWKKPSVLIQDICIILGIAGSGSVLGLAFRPEMIAVLLVVFSIYDFIAVYKTKHMVKMAEEMIKSQAILGLVVPSDVAGFSKSLKGVGPGGNFLILGGGDIVFPLLFSSSLIPFGIFDSLIVALFSLIGLLAGFLFFISQKKRQAIPALPPIAIFSIIGFLITKIL
ncbi:MAG: presenilin family intramembrane aspartyl protease [Patescibacteria group bacterium]|nr:presenilin family intramembrane aspartyl protease [Patescibacteria group bacterium]